MNECSGTRRNQSIYVAKCCDVISRAFRRARTYPMAKKGVADSCYNVHTNIKVFSLRSYVDSYRYA